MKNICLSFSLLLVFISAGFGQVITVTPPLPNDQSSVEVIFDAAQGSAGLLGYTADVYAHTGVITNQSTSSSDWKYVKAGWTENIPDCKLAPLGNNKWKLLIGPSIRAYYKNVPASEVIQKMAFVFRSADGTKTGKTAEGTDIFYDVFTSTLSVKITAPAEDFLFVSLNAAVHVEVSSLLADSTILYLDGLKKIATTSALLTYDINATVYGRHLVKAVAKSATTAVVDSFYFYVRPPVIVSEIPAGMKDGINYLSGTSVLLSLYAPFKEFAYAIGDFNNWLPDDLSYMKRTPDGKRYWVQLDGLVPAKEYIYQYLVDNNIRIGDPYAAKVSDPWNDQYIPAETYPGLIPYPAGKTQGIATVFQTAQTPYNWSNIAFTPPKKTDLIIYELLVRDFADKHSFQSVMDTIGYLYKLGVNVIELMPVNEFEGNLSWGYNPNYYFAVDKYYGNQNKLKQLVDTCHQLGIAVIGDMVLNHSYGTSPLVQLYWDAANSRPAANNPWYNVTSPNTAYSWGSDFNHESPDTKRLVDSILSYWMSDFHLDGFRFDFTKGFTNKPGDGGPYDASRIAILKRMATEMWKRNPDAYVIFEHLTDNSEEKELANFGIMLWGNMNNNYCQSAMGYSTDNDLSWGSYTSRGWSEPNLVTYMESHDEERQMYKSEKWGSTNGSYSIKDTATALKRAALAATFFYTIPGPKMLWQFGERGYDYSIGYPTYTSDSRLAQKPPRWDYMKNYNRLDLYDLVTSLIKLHTEDPIFETTDFDFTLSGLMKKIRLRTATSSMVVIGNFDLKEGAITPNFYNTGKWYELFSKDSLTVTNTGVSLTLKAGEYRIYSNKKLPFPYLIDNTDASKTQVRVTPNPVNDRCTIEISFPGISDCNVDIYNPNGTLVDRIFKGQVENKLLLQWQPATSGTFIVKVQIGNQTTVKKIVSIKQ